MKSLNAFQRLIELLSKMWNALLGRARPAAIATDDPFAASNPSEADSQNRASLGKRPKKVMSASEEIAAREEAITATIYIDPVEAEPAHAAAELGAQAIIGNAEEEQVGDARDPVWQDHGADSAAHEETKHEESAIEEWAAEAMPNGDPHADGDERAVGGEAEPLEQPLHKTSGQSSQPSTNGHVAGQSASGTPAAIEDAVDAEAEISPEQGTKHLVDEAVAQAIPDEFFIELNGEQTALTSLLESLLFVSDATLEPAQVAKVLPCTTEQIEAGLQRLRMLYQQEKRGLRVQERNGRYALVSMPAAAAVIEAFLNLDLDTRLSGPALEALAVIAYRQPVTRSQIEAVRGVDCGHVLRVLLQHELIEETGRLETVGRPILYGITDRFLQHFGLTSMNELPKLETSEADMLWAATQLAAEEAESDA